MRDYYSIIKNHLKEYLIILSVPLVATFASGCVGFPIRMRDYDGNPVFLQRNGTYAVINVEGGNITGVTQVEPGSELEKKIEEPTPPPVDSPSSTSEPIPSE